MLFIQRKEKRGKDGTDVEDGVGAELLSPLEHVGPHLLGLFDLELARAEEAQHHVVVVVARGQQLLQHQRLPERVHLLHLLRVAHVLDRHRHHLAAAPPHRLAAQRAPEQLRRRAHRAVPQRRARRQRPPLLAGLRRRAAGGRRGHRAGGGDDGSIRRQRRRPATGRAAPLHHRPGRSIIHTY